MSSFNPNKPELFFQERELEIFKNNSCLGTRYTIFINGDIIDTITNKEVLDYTEKNKKTIKNILLDILENKRLELQRNLSNTKKIMKNIKSSKRIFRK